MKKIFLLFVFIALYYLMLPAQTYSAFSKPFRPFENGKYVSTNGISFSKDGYTMYMSLRLKNEIGFALYSTQFINNSWTEPKRLGFSEPEFGDYEPTISPDGTFLVFNANRPLPGTTEPTENPRLWISKKKDGEWTVPKPLEITNPSEHASSYATFTNNGDLYFFSSSRPIASRPSGAPSEAGQPLYEAIYYSKKTTTGFEPPIFIDQLLPVSKKGQKIGIGDPWISPNGDFIIYTIYDDEVGWASTCDLVISFKENNTWGTPRKLDIINTARSDNAPSGTYDKKWLYYRSKGRLLKIELQTLLNSLEN